MPDTLTFDIVTPIHSKRKRNFLSILLFLVPIIIIGSLISLLEVFIFQGKFPFYIGITILFLFVILFDKLEKKVINATKKRGNLIFKEGRLIIEASSKVVLQNSEIHYFLITPALTVGKGVPYTRLIQLMVKDHSVYEFEIMSTSNELKPKKRFGIFSVNFSIQEALEFFKIKNDTLTERKNYHTIQL